MKPIEEIREYFRGDRFATDQGMVVDRVGQDGAVCSVELREGHNNAIGRVQGGLIYTLADFAFAVAVNYEEARTVTLDSTIHYLRPPAGKRLVATAVCRHRSRSICIYQIDVADELGTAVAQLTATGFTRA